MPTNDRYTLVLRADRVVLVTNDYETLDELDDDLSQVDGLDVAFRFDVRDEHGETCHEILFPEGMTVAQVQQLLASNPE